MTDLLSQGIAAARAGKREEARQLLMRLVEADERNEQGWLWLAGVVDDPADIRTCLHNVLDLNPANQQARQGLAWVESRYRLSAPPPAPASEPPTSAPAPLGEREVAMPAPLAEPRQAEAAPPEPPEPRRSYTGPAAKLGAEYSVAPPAARPAAPIEPIAVAPPDHPCPYCGAPTVLKQQACTQCRGDLLVRAAPSDKRSLALTVLGVLWGIGGVLVLLMAVLAFLLFLRVRQSAPAGPAAPSADTLLIVVAVTLVIGMLYIGMARGLLARRRWAYYANVVLIALSLLGTLSSVAAGTMAIAVLLGSRGSAGSAAGPISLIVSAALGVAFVLLPIALTLLSYRDFYGPRVRFQPVVEPAEHLVHYNNGIAYKNRGMWYMAAQEWEAAVGKKPREATYLHALGLAYAQLKQPEKARATLDRAIQSAPDNPQIKESRTLVDQMATKK